MLPRSRWIHRETASIRPRSRDSRLEGARDWAGRQLLVSRVKHDRRPGICRDNGRYVSKIAYRLDDTASEMKLVVYRDCEVTQAQLKEFDRLAGSMKNR